jgi:hypothetical protein
MFVAKEAPSGAPGTEQDTDPVRAEVAKFFDAKHYLQVNPDVRASLLDPLDHFVAYGAKEGRAPNRWFDERHYLSQLAGRELGILPAFVHWVLEGRREGLAPAANVVVTIDDRILVAHGHEDCLDCTTMRGTFDAAYYANKYADVRTESGTLDLLAHFCSSGWKERRAPAPWFSVDDYFAFYPDVHAANVNPFVHYLAQGKTEGRIVKAKDASRSWILDRIAPAAARMKVAPPPPSDRIASFDLGTLAPDLGTRAGVVLSFGADVYVKHLGGVQVFTRDEQTRFNGLGWLYVHVAPISPTLSVKHGGLGGQATLVAVTVDGRYIGVAPLADVIAEVLAVRNNGQSTAAIVQSLLGFDLTDLGTTLKASFETVYLWLHDFHSACAGFNLMRNDVEFCGLPKLGASACEVCVYGPERRTNEAALTKFFYDVRPVVCSPSQVALEIWKRAGRAHREAIVIPHLTLEQAQAPRKAAAPHAPLRIAFLGHCAALKGWRAFLRLVDAYSHLPEYEFWHLGDAPGEDSRVHFKRTANTPATRNQMEKTIETLGIDVTFIFSTWPETYSYTFFESILGGARVLTHQDSGNVRANVEAMKVGLVFADEDDVFESFAKPQELKLRLDACAAPSIRQTGVGTTASLFTGKQP